MSEYWLISAPGDKTCQQTFDTMNNLTSKQNNLCNNYKFHIPDLKVGTLDQLVGLSDDLGKLDAYVETITRKVAAYLGEVLEDQRDKLHENLLANNSPGPPDESARTTKTNTKKISHSNLTGKSSNLSNSRDTTTTTCSACHSGANLNNTSSSADETSEREYDDLFLSSPACNCDECIAAVTTVGVPSASTTATTFITDECYSHASSTTLNVQNQQQQQQQQLTTASATVSSTAAAIAAASSTTCAISYMNNTRQLTMPSASTTTTTLNTLLMPDNASSSSPSPSPTTTSTTCTGNSGGGNSSSCYYYSTSTSSCQHQQQQQQHQQQHNHHQQQQQHHHHRSSNNRLNNNNTCSINNNNRLLGFSFSPSSFGFTTTTSTTQQTTNQQQQQQQQQHHHVSHRLHQQSPKHHHSHTTMNNSENDGSGGGIGGCGGVGHVTFTSSKETNLEKTSSVSDVSDTFDWWFSKPRRSSKKNSHPQNYSDRSSTSQLNTINNGFNFTSTHRSSPVSSCCGSSSRGRSSPDTDTGEPPAFPLSPADLSVYITRFQWDMAKYPIKQSLRNIADIISKQIGQIDADLKTKSAAYNNLKGTLQNLEKKQTGSLLTRNLADLVKKEHFILDSEYLTTLLVIVPKVMANDWLANYEKITDMIVPRSSQLITQDNEYCLFNVTLFKKVVEEFKLHAREKKFIVRDFVYNEEELAAGKNEMTKLITDKKKQFGPLVRWLKVNFSEAFCALIHVKALRVFVESVLRYGLPVNFQAILIEPHKKSMKRLRECLNQLYGHLDGTSAGNLGSGADNVDIPGLGFGASEYYPYVFYKINIDMVDNTKM